jgi:bifunctional enzyme CysN/CysC
MEDRKRRGTSDGAAAAPLRHRRLGRRRQVDAHRPPAVRHEGDLRGPARGGRAHQRAAGDDYTDLALLTDGLRAEREQGITIDVAYRYFATPRRKFIIADTPGHVQYTRNMVTGASTADLAIVLVDARKGVVEQTRATPSSPRCWASRTSCSRQQDGPRRLRRGGFERSGGVPRVRHQARRPDLTFIPISALHGDNVVDRSPNMPWYEGPSLLHHLEHVHIASDRNLIDVRFPVQYVIRPQSTSTTTTAATPGRSPAACFKPGDEVVVLPSGSPRRSPRSTPSTGPSTRRSRRCR